MTTTNEIHRTAIRIPHPEDANETIGYRHRVEMNGHVYDGYGMVCPVDGAMRYAGHHQFTCSCGVWNVGGVVGSRYEVTAIGEGDNRHIPTIHAFLDNARLDMLHEVKKLRTRAAWGVRRCEMMGSRYTLDLHEASPEAVEYLRQNHHREYLALKAQS